MDKLSMTIGAICIVGSLGFLGFILLVIAYNISNRNNKHNPRVDLSPRDQKVVSEAVSILQASGNGPNYSAVAKLYSAEACPSAVDLVEYMRQHVLENLQNSADDYNGQLLQDIKDQPQADRSQITGDLAQKITRAETAINARRDATGRYIAPGDGSNKPVVKWRENTWIEK